MAGKRIAIGADHGGFALKQDLVGYLREQGHQVEDCGSHSTESVDYPRIALAVASRVARGEAEVGIMVDGAGIGSAMAANKVPGVRAAMCYDVSTAKNSREHNNANVLTLGAGLIGTNLARQIVDAWLAAECTVDRHLRRAGMIGEIERGWSGEGAGTPDISDQDLERIAHQVQLLLAERGGILSEGLCAELPPDTLQRFIDLGVCRVSGSPSGPRVPEALASYFDHTILKPDATSAVIEKLCAEAREYGFASVCINPNHVKLAAKLLRGSPVKVCTVVGFPLGAHQPEIKATETRRAIRDGAREIDMVINVGALKDGDDDLVLRDIRGVADACRESGALSKVIIEAALLTDEEKVRACELARRAKADFVKTSTGFGPGGATAHDVAIMSQVVQGTKMGVKAAGGIKTLDDAQAMIAAGATRLGASASIQIMQQAEKAVVPGAMQSS
jgi:deoxyribose-phosphate aldolase